jgi:CMP-N-acetylneuraminic acid synthetase
MVEKTVSVVINARLNSSRCPNKHIRPMAGTTLIDECLKKVNSLSGLKNSYLATGDQKLIEKSLAYKNVQHLSRIPESYAKGQVPFSVAFEHYARVDSDYIMIINPCQPLVDTKIYQDAIDWFKGCTHEGAVSVVKERNYFFFDNGDIANFGPQSRLCSVSGPAMLKCTHTFMIFNKAFFIKNGTLWPNSNGDPHPIEIPDSGLHDVDTEEDFLVISNILKERLNNEI